MPKMAYSHNLSNMALLQCGQVIISFLIVIKEVMCLPIYEEIV